MAGVEHGVVRQVWFAPVSDPSDKNSFLIRDDAYSKREAVFGRTIRLGDPVDLGPFGAWRQTNWSGGHDQETWKDEAMFELGTADVSERKGSAKLWNGWKGILENPGRPGASMPHLAAAATGVSDDVPLVSAEMFERLGSTTTSATYRIRSSDVVSGNYDIDAIGTDPVMALSRVGNETGAANGYMLIGYQSGTVKLWRQSDDTITTETVPGVGGIGFKAMAPFNNATYYGRSNRLQKRVGTTHSIVRQIPEISSISCITVWNNRLWFAGMAGGGQAGIYVSDGYTVQLAFILPMSMNVYDICPHYGSLYIRGVTDIRGSSANDERQVVYRYNGSSLTLLWEDDTPGPKMEFHGGMVSWGRHLCWSKHGSDEWGRQAGVWMYDAEEDAVYIGPTISMDPASDLLLVSALCVWNNQLAAVFEDLHTYTATTNENPKMVAVLEKTQRVRSVNLDGTSTVDQDPVVDDFSNYSFSGVSYRYAHANKEQVILSSSYDGGLPGEKKSWVKGYIRCRVPQGCQVELVLLHDDDVTEHSVQTVSYSAGVGSGWQDVQFSAVCATHSVHEKSSKVRYKLYLRNVDLTNYPNNTPEVDVVGLDFMPAPSRRSQYHVRTVCDDDQQDLAGNANALTTREALVAKLTEYWENGEPVLFWEPSADGTTPTGSTGSKTVLVQDFLEQTYRIASDDTTATSEVSFNLLEVA